MYHFVIFQTKLSPNRKEIRYVFPPLIDVKNILECNRPLPAWNVFRTFVSEWAIFWCLSEGLCLFFFFLFSVDAKLSYHVYSFRRRKHVISSIFLDSGRTNAFLKRETQLFSAFRNSHCCLSLSISNSTIPRRFPANFLSLILRFLLELFLEALQKFCFCLEIRFR